MRIRATMRTVEVILKAVGEAVRLIWRVVGPVLSIVLQVLAALLVLFEEWGWRPLSAALARLARFRLWARAELAIAGLPPYAALAVIALPSALLFPLKFVAVWLVANGYVVGAAALFIAAKIVSTALIARVFMLVKPALMQIAWFASLYGRFVPWKEALFARIRATWVWRYGRMIKTTVRHEALMAWRHWQPRLKAARARFSLRAAHAWKRLRKTFGDGATKE